MQIIILIEPLGEGRFCARAGEPFAMTAEADSADEAVRNLETMLRDRLHGGGRLAVIDLRNGLPAPLQTPPKLDAVPENEWFFETMRQAIAENRRRRQDMAETNPYDPDRLDAIERRLCRLEERLDQRDMCEAAVAPWQYLVRRHHPWRMQLYVKGRNMTARQLVGAMKANQLDEAAVAADYRLPVEVVREAVAYVASNWELLVTEAEIERLMLKRGGVARGPQPVS